MRISLIIACAASIRANLDLVRLIIIIVVLAVMDVRSESSEEDNEVTAMEIY